MPAPDYWPVLKVYHRVREPVYRDILAKSGIGPNDRVLDAGCGDAFYGRLMIDVLGCDLRIVGLDHNPALLPSPGDPDPAIQLCLGDLEQIGLRQGAFDAVWLCRSMHSASDPLRRLAALAPLLRPGGRLIVIENDLAHSQVLSWPAAFEARVQRALLEHLQNACPAGESIERYYAARHLPQWLGRIGLCAVSVHTYSVEDVAPMAREVEAYWRLAMSYLGDRIRPFLSGEDWQTYSQAFDAESSEYRLNQPGFYCRESITVACGRAP